MNHVNFMFLPGSCGDFFVKSLHLINGVSIEGSCMNGFSAQEKFLAHSYSNAKKYKNYIQFEDANTIETSWNHTEIDRCNTMVWYKNNHAFTNLQKDNILGESEIEIRIIMNWKNMEKFVLCNAFFKKTSITSEYLDKHNRAMQEAMQDTSIILVNLQNIVDSEAKFLEEYYNIAQNICNETDINEEYAVMLYNEWKTTLPTNFDDIPLEKYLLKS